MYASRDGIYLFILHKTLLYKGKAECEGQLIVLRDKVKSVMTRYDLDRLEDSGYWIKL